jgi:hypothetical protein
MAKKERLEELIRTATNHLLTKEEKIGYIADPELKQRLFKKFPDCFISMNRMGQDFSDYLLPLCNRAGILDPVAINISYKTVEKLMSDETGGFDINTLNSVLDRLDKLKTKYSKSPVRPPQAAARKAIVTRMFNNIKSHLRK